jgi:hypothetical protein
LIRWTGGVPGLPSTFPDWFLFLRPASAVQKALEPAHISVWINERR